MDGDRPPVVAAEIADLPPLGTPECEQHVRARGSHLTPETLVHVIRAGVEAGNTSLFELCGRLLIGQRSEDGRWQGGHCEAIIMSLARYYGFHLDRDLLHDYRQRCHAELWLAIYAGGTDKPLWESRYGLCLKQKCIDVARTVARERQRRQTHEGLGPEGDEQPLSQLPDPSDLEASVLGRVEAEALEAAIRRLPPRQAEAALLAWVEGRPLATDSDGSVAAVMGISPSAVHQLLAKARANLRKDPVIRSQADER